MSVSQVNALSPLDPVSSMTAAARANAQTATTPTSSTGSTSGLMSTTTGTTFLNLLVKELQNQDPSAPMDSTAMVGQMISLNQLDQLIGINQTLAATTSSTAPGTGATGTGTGTGTTGATPVAHLAASGQTSSSADLMAARASLLNSTGTPTAAQAATIAASDPSSVLQLSTLNNLYGAK